MKKIMILSLGLCSVLMFTPCAFSDVFLAPDGTGTYVGGLPNLIPNGAYVGGTSTITLDGIYVDGEVKKKSIFRNWKQKHKFDN